MTDEMLVEMLGALEQLLEHAKRQSLVLTQLITTMKAGGRLSNETLDDYANQLAGAQQEHTRLDAQITAFWAQLGDDRPVRLH